MKVDDQIRLKLLGLIRDAEFNLSEAVAALEPDAPEVFKESLVLAASSIDSAKRLWLEHQR